MGAKWEAKVRERMLAIEDDIKHLHGGPALARLKRRAAEAEVQLDGAQRQIRDMVAEEERASKQPPRRTILSLLTGYELDIGSAKAAQIYERNGFRRPIDDLSNKELALYFGQVLGEWLELHGSKRKAG